MEKIWLQSYEAGVPAEIDISRYESIISVFEESVQKYGAQTAFENMGKASAMPNWRSRRSNLPHFCKTRSSCRAASAWR